MKGLNEGIDRSFRLVWDLTFLLISHKKVLANLSSFPATASGEQNISMLTLW